MVAAGWILGAFFFIFVFAAIVYISRTETAPPDTIPPAIASATVGGRVVMEGAGIYRIRREYRIQAPAHAFVAYPYGLAVVFPIENARPRPVDVRRGFQSGDYSHWAEPEQDPQLIVTHGRFEFEADTPDPVLRVAVRLPPECFDADRIAAQDRLQPDRETAFELWLDPTLPRSTTVTVVLCHVSSDGHERQLAAIPVNVSVEPFPIRLR